VRRALPEHLGPFRPPPIQDERVPRGVLPEPPCPGCGRRRGGSDRFKRTLDRAASGTARYEALVELVRALYPVACWGN